MKWLLTIIIFSSNYRCKNWNVRSINCLNNMRNPMNCVNSCAEVLNWAEVGNRTKMHNKWIFNHLQNFLTIFELVLLTTLYTSPTIHKVFPISSLCNAIATPPSIEIASHTCILHLQIQVNIFFVKEPNNYLLGNPTFLSNAHTQWSLMFILSKQMQMQKRAFSHSPLSANACISNTCCTIVYKYRY